MATDYIKYGNRKIEVSFTASGLPVATLGEHSVTAAALTPEAIASAVQDVNKAAWLSEQAVLEADRAAAALAKARSEALADARRLLGH